MLFKCRYCPKIKTVQPFHSYGNKRFTCDDCRRKLAALEERKPKRDTVVTFVFCSQSTNRA